jgi:cytochrome P450
VSFTGPEPPSTNSLRRARICLGMRFGQLEIKAIAAAVTERFRVELRDGFRLRIRQTPALGPSAGLPVRVRVARGPREG